MSEFKASSPSLHPRNRHQNKDGVAYDLKVLQAANPDLAPHVITKNSGHQTIDFADANAVKELNRALLLAYYDIQFWHLPEQFLCPPIPGRADYIHHLADVLAASNKGEIPTGKSVRGIDIGTGANLVYPIIGRHEYKWTFVASELNSVSFQCANAIAKSNKGLNSHLKLVQQNNPKSIFNGVLNPTHKYAFSMCNPPFHASAEEAEAGSRQKRSNLENHKKRNQNNPESGFSSSTAKSKALNFGGQNSELWCEGGEVEFVCKMIKESVQFGHQVLWFSSLVSKKDSLKFIQKELDFINKKKAKLMVKVIDMGQGQKTSRFIAWSFVPEHLHETWFK